MAIFSTQLVNRGSYCRELAGWDYQGALSSFGIVDCQPAIKSVIDQVPLGGVLFIRAELIVC